MNVGFIGVGIIGSAVAMGLCKKNPDMNIFLSPRSRANSEALANQFKNATVCADNQEVCDKSEWLFLSLLAKDAGEILRDLKFNKNHKIVNVTVGFPLSELVEITGETKILCHVIPLPFIRDGYGPIAAFPENQEVFDLLSPLGDVVFTKSLHEIKVLQSVTGLMSSINELFREFIEFSKSEGVNEREAIKYTASFFAALAKQWPEYKGDLYDLAREMTPGGLNEQALNYVIENDGIKPWIDILTPLMNRIK